MLLSMPGGAHPQGSWVVVRVSREL